MGVVLWIDVDFRRINSARKDLARAHNHRTAPSGRADDAELTFRRGIRNLFEYFAGLGLIFRPFISKFSELVFYFVPIFRQELRPCKKLRPIVSMHRSEPDLRESHAI